uniref:Uncharacterized protein n=1 Tax=Steinernema glaseri TaxID=37863 RepID=A0A1I8AXH8_9BILA
MIGQGGNGWVSRSDRFTDPNASVSVTTATRKRVSWNEHQAVTSRKPRFGPKHQEATTYTTSMIKHLSADRSPLLEDTTSMIKHLSADRSPLVGRVVAYPARRWKNRTIMRTRDVNVEESDRFRNRE